VAGHIASSPPAAPHPRRFRVEAFWYSRRRGLANTATVVSTSFPSLDAGRGPATPAKSAMNPATPSCGEIDAV